MVLQYFQCMLFFKSFSTKVIHLLVYFHQGDGWVRRSGGDAVVPLPALARRPAHSHVRLTPRYAHGYRAAVSGRREIHSQHLSPRCGRPPLRLLP